MTKQKSLVLSLIAVLFLGTVSIGQVKADDNCNTQTDPHCGASCHVGYHFDGTSCQPWLNSYTQHPTVKQIVYCKQWDTEGFACKKFSDDSIKSSPNVQTVVWDCSKNLNNPNCGFSDSQQPQVTTVAYETNNCFWSFPVICN